MTCAKDKQLLKVIENVIVLAAAARKHRAGLIVRWRNMRSPLNRAIQSCLRGASRAGQEHARYSPGHKLHPQPIVGQLMHLPLLPIGTMATPFGYPRAANTHGLDADEPDPAI